MDSAGQVLVVDDDPTIRAVMSATLLDAGYQVAEAKDGRDALQQMGSAPPFVVLLDLNMPVMDGWAMYREMRQCGMTVPVVIVSAMDSKKTARELGAFRGINKPFDIDELLTVVEEARQLPHGN